MNPLAILSVSCFIVAGILFAYWLYDRRRLMRGLTEDAELDRAFDPYRAQPDWMKQNQINQRKP